MLLAVHDTLIVATDSLLYIGAKGGSLWASRNAPVTAPDAMSCLLHTNGELLTGTFKSGVFRSTDDGASWLAFSIGLSGLGSVKEAEAKAAMIGPE